MADPRRFEVFADYIVSHYPDLSLRIADVAGNHGDLNRALKERGYRRVVTIDPGWRPCYGLEGTVEAFVPEMARFYDLVAALDSHDVTSKVIWAARYAPTAFVPCCVKRNGKWETLEGENYFLLIEKPLITAGAQYESDTLELAQYNRVYRTIPRNQRPMKVALDDDPNADAWY